MVCRRTKNQKVNPNWENTSVAAQTSFSFHSFKKKKKNFERLHFRSGGPGRGGCSLRQASPQERTPPPKSLCPPSSERLCQASTYNLVVQMVLFPGPGLLRRPRTFLCGFAAAGASYPLPHYPGHGPVVSPTVPQPRSRPLAVATAGRAGWRFRRVFNVAGYLQVPHCQGGCAQFPRPGRPQAAESGRASILAAGLGYFLETFLPHHRSSRRRKSLWKAHDPSQRTPRRPLSSGGLAQRDQFPGVRGPSRAATRSHPYRRAPMIRSPADFESLPGSLAAKGRSPKRAELWRTTAAFGDRPLPSPCLQSAPHHCVLDCPEPQTRARKN